MNIHFDFVQGPALRVLAKALIEIADLEEQLAGVSKQQPQEDDAAKKEPVPELSLEYVRKELKKISDGGKKKEIQELLAAYGAARLTEISPDLFSEVLAKAEAL